MAHLWVVSTTAQPARTSSVMASHSSCLEQVSIPELGSSWREDTWRWTSEPLWQTPAPTATAAATTHAVSQVGGPHPSWLPGTLAPQPLTFQKRPRPLKACRAVAGEVSLVQ